MAKSLLTGTDIFYPSGTPIYIYLIYLSHSNVYNGMWQIKGNIATLTVTSSSGFKPTGYEPDKRTGGNVTHASRLDDGELVYSIQTGIYTQTLAFTREK